jgi:hypothetical protein
MYICTLFVILNIIWQSFTGTWQRGEFFNIPDDLCFLFAEIFNCITTVCKALFLIGDVFALLLVDDFCFVSLITMF